MTSIIQKWNINSPQRNLKSLKTSNTLNSTRVSAQISTNIYPKFTVTGNTVTINEGILSTKRAQLPTSTFTATPNTFKNGTNSNKSDAFRLTSNTMMHKKKSFDQLMKYNMNNCMELLEDDIDRVNKKIKRATLMGMGKANRKVTFNIQN